ncbi:MAG: hypothetical protein ACLP5H_29375 [Desulfomonilaceae bacterium]
MNALMVLREIRNAADHKNKAGESHSCRPLPYIVAFTAGKIFVECLKKADAAEELNGEGLTKVLKSLKDFDTGGSHHR